ncbi:hypothetical protein [Bradyrhizobium canariense]|uniref:hypothetical protein n=1 Tax=Bradyrhizobium canariense TaxID=255045 RepID=UPI001B8A8193|nr:hypothetical protein [Bradyrhizobium canariense]MBR0951230.1 hypothetical protein [Bradyrhizobium canariense]
MHAFWLMSYWPRSLRLAVALLSSSMIVAAADAAESPLKDIRLSADGAGPSHIFWLSGATSTPSNADVIGVIDPLLSAIRLYSVRRSSGGEALEGRLQALGSCALPVSFRPWRVLHVKDEVRIESMPRPGSDGHNANRQAFKSDVYVITRDFAATASPGALTLAGSQIATPQWNPANALQCGTLTLTDAPVGRSAPFTAVRGANRPKRTIIWRSTADSLSAGEPMIVRARTGGLYYLVSVKELEPAPPRRVVLITEGVPTSDGMVRLNQRLLLFGENGSKPLREIGFDDTHFRSKLGQKPLAVLPTGEVLAMGRDLIPLAGDAGSDIAFRIQSCGFLGQNGTSQTSLCSDAGNVVESRHNADTIPSQAARQVVDPSPAVVARKETANSIFSNVKKFAELPWEVDASVLPEPCRTIDGCLPSGGRKPFVALKGIRLTRGSYRQIGFPYAQTESFRDVDAFFEAVDQRRLTIALQNVLTRPAGLPGNLKDDFRGDLGIDCSAFLQAAWSGRSADPDDRISTGVLQNERLRFVCPDRLPDVSHLRSGDAIGIHVSPGADHVVLYAANVAFDGASEFWLVQESTSACDGVCWSVYDPSFFNGWGLYRASNRSDKSCPQSNPEASISATSFPTDYSNWRNAVVRGLPLHR